VVHVAFLPTTKLASIRLASGAARQATSYRSPQADILVVVDLEVGTKSAKQRLNSLAAVGFVVSLARAP